MMVIAVIDYFTFYNYPIQRNLILAKGERSNAENYKLIELAQAGTSKKLFSDFFKGENRSKLGFRVSFLNVLSMKEMQIILVGGVLKHVADRL